MGNHLGLFSEAPDRPDGQEGDVWAVGGQGPFQEVNLKLLFEPPLEILNFVSNHRFLAWEIN